MTPPRTNMHAYVHIARALKFLKYVCRIQNIKRYQALSYILRPLEAFPFFCVWRGKNHNGSSYFY